MVDVDDRHADLLQEGGGQDLHVAGEHDEVNVAVQQLELAPLGRRLGVPGHRNVLERDAERDHVRPEVGVVGDDQDRPDRQFAPALPPQQVEEAVVLTGHEERHPGGDGGVAQAELRAERARHLVGEPALDLGQPGGHAGQVELGAQKELTAGRTGRVLVGLHDVGAVAMQERGDTGDDARPVRA